MWTVIQTAFSTIVWSLPRYCLEACRANAREGWRGLPGPLQRCIGRHSANVPVRPYNGVLPRRYQCPRRTHGAARTVARQSGMRPTAAHRRRQPGQRLHPRPHPAARARLDRAPAPTRPHHLDQPVGHRYQRTPPPAPSHTTEPMPQPTHPNEDSLRFWVNPDDTGWERNTCLREAPPPPPRKPEPEPPPPPPPQPRPCTVDPDDDTPPF